MEQRRSARAREIGDPRENLLTSGIIRRDSHMRKNQGSDYAGNRLGGRRDCSRFSILAPNVQRSQRLFGILGSGSNSQDGRRDARRVSRWPRGNTSLIYEANSEKNKFPTTIRIMTPQLPDNSKKQSSTLTSSANPGRIRAVLGPTQTVPELSSGRARVEPAHARAVPRPSPGCVTVQLGPCQGESGPCHSRARAVPGSSPGHATVEPGPCQGRAGPCKGRAKTEPGLCHGPARAVPGRVRSVPQSSPGRARVQPGPCHRRARAVPGSSRAMQGACQDRARAVPGSSSGRARAARSVPGSTPFRARAGVWIAPGPDTGVPHCSVPRACQELEEEAEEEHRRGERLKRKLWIHSACISTGSPFHTLGCNQPNDGVLLAEAPTGVKLSHFNGPAYQAGSRELQSGRGVAVAVMWVCPFSDWLRELLERDLCVVGDRDNARHSVLDDVYLKPRYIYIMFKIGSQFIRHAQMNSEPGRNTSTKSRGTRSEVKLTTHSSSSQSAES
ncbi:hypothetical protein PR048_007245 [Dryococelus australis]|uniref:Uncharacterized protein n=1 Tax=Dryococelus australis TaxID=614101 RepID=A0ABQ9ID37_9NEOP|nr:hypothetical protein PR048_007245 [Dryococelus australis]